VHVDDPPALNPTGGVTRKMPSTSKGLKYKKDASRPGGGVFIAHGKAKAADYTGILEGVVINASDEDESEGEDSAAEVSSIVQPSNDNDPASSSSSPHSSHHVVGLPLPGARAGRAGAGSPAAAATQSAVSGDDSTPATAPIVNYTPLGPDYTNVNPTLNSTGRSDVQVLNILDVPQAPNTLEQVAVADSGMLEGLPGSMFDWPQWDQFFSRFNAPADPNTLAAFAQVQAHAQAQQAEHVGPSNGNQPSQHYQNNGS